MPSPHSYKYSKRTTFVAKEPLIATSRNHTSKSQANLKKSFLPFQICGFRYQACLKPVEAS